MGLRNLLRRYYITTLFSIIFAVVGFSYNAWRLEISEDNYNIRTASFEVLANLSEFEHVVYAAHFDHNKVEGSPRKGWVKVGLVVDLSALISPQVHQQAEALHHTWANSWQSIDTQRQTVDTLVQHVEAVRNAIKGTLQQLD